MPEFTLTLIFNAVYFSEAWDQLNTLMWASERSMSSCWQMKNLTIWAYALHFKRGGKIISLPIIRKQKCCTCYLSQMTDDTKGWTAGRMYVHWSLDKGWAIPMTCTHRMRWDRVWRGKCQTCAITNNAFWSSHYVCFLHPESHPLMVINIITGGKKAFIMPSVIFLTEISTLTTKSKHVQ